MRYTFRTLHLLRLFESFSGKKVRGEAEAVQKLDTT